MYKSPCVHLKSLSDSPLAEILLSKTKVKCADCDCTGPNLWMCLNLNCLRIGCSENYNDHNTNHNQMHPAHSLHMNLSTKRIWCYQCETEVFPESLEIYNRESQRRMDQQPDDHGYVRCNKQHAENNEQDNVFAFESAVGLNVSMSGDTSDSSDADDDNSNIEPDKPFGLVGLQNIGNTCYMNAALQALSNTLPLTSFFLECSAAVLLLSEGRKPGLSRTYQALIKDMWVKKKYGYVTPSGILYGIRNVHAMFRGYHQHDTQEFLRNFMDQLHEELKQQCPPGSVNDIDAYNVTAEESSVNSSFESSEGEYETCDSGVSERSSLSDETERPANITKRKLARSTSPVRRFRSRLQSGTIDPQLPNTKQQAKYRSIISDIFDGKLLSSVQCLTCSRISSRVETFQDLSLPIPSRDHLAVLHGRGADAGGVACSEAVLPLQDGWLSWFVSWLKSWFYGPTVSLHDCLAAFFSTDELKGDNMYSCERCNKLRNGIKFSKVLQLPEVLCIHLKRFRHELMFSSKISSFVSFPLRNLDVRQYLHADCVSNISTFDLFSVICHHGTAGGGHYTCYSLNGNQWYEFDDQYVTKVAPETVQGCEAYVLFYRKSTWTAQTVKARVNELAESCRTDGRHEEAAYMSKQWLSRFKTCAEPGPIDNSDFLCQHGLMQPERVSALHQLAVALPKPVYDHLHKRFGGCPSVSGVHACPACTVLQRRQAHEMDTFLKLNRDYLNRRLPTSHLLSTAWFGQWQNFVQRRTCDPPGPIDNNGRAAAGSASDYLEIDREIWAFFQIIYGGGPEMPIYSNKASQSMAMEGGDVSNTDANSDSEGSSFKRQGDPGPRQFRGGRASVGDVAAPPQVAESSCKGVAAAAVAGSPPPGARKDYPGGPEVGARTDPNNCAGDKNVTVRSSALSSGSNTSLTDDEPAQAGSADAGRKAASRNVKERLHRRTRRRRLRCNKLGYKSKQPIVGKYIKYKDVY